MCSSDLFLADTVREMASKRIRNALAFVTSPYGSDFSCLHYRNAIESARAEAGASAPEIRKIRLFFNHPRFIRAQVLRLEEAMLASKTGPGLTPLMFTAHSLPSEYPSSALYERQIREACSLVASRCGFADWELAFQSRSGDPSRPWLGPTPEAGIRRLAELGARKVLVHPIGFMFDNMEIVYDLDEEASNLADGLGLRMIRVKTAGDHPEIIGMIRSLILEQKDERVPRDCLGTMGPPEIGRAHV